MSVPVQGTYVIKSIPQNKLVKNAPDSIVVVDSSQVSEDTKWELTHAESTGSSSTKIVLQNVATRRFLSTNKEDSLLFPGYPGTEAPIWQLIPVIENSGSGEIWYVSGEDGKTFWFLEEGKIEIGISTKQHSAWAFGLILMDK